MAASSTAHRRTSCVKCNLFQPRDGKLLHCIHVTCASCGVDEVERETNSIKCLFCRKITKATVSGVEVLEQLKNCNTLLYNSSEEEQYSSAAASHRGKPNRRLCELCEDDDAAIASHECQGCSGALLCRKHAERHPRIRLYSGHVVMELVGDQRANGGHRGLENQSARCFFHKQQKVVTFCKTCSHAVCGACLSAAHQGHTMLTLSSVAEEQRAAVRTAMESCKNSLQSADTVQSAGSMDTPPIQAMLIAVSNDMDEIRQEAETASRIVTETFDRVDSINQQKRQQLLHQIDSIRWQQLEVRESHQQRLYNMDENYATLIELVEIMTSGGMEDVDVVRLAGVVNANLSKMSLDVESEKTPLPRCEIVAAPVTQVIRILEKQVQSVVLVNPAQPVLDPEKCSQRITLSHNNCIATLSGSKIWSTVVAKQGYTRGRHVWNVRFLDQKSKGEDLGAGVTVLPSDGSYDAGKYFFKGAYSWDGCGGGYNDGTRNRKDCSRFNDGDVASLTLDCDKATLEIHHHRTGERRVVTGIQCDQALYPAFSFHLHGQQLEFC